MFLERFVYVNKENQEIETLIQSKIPCDDCPPLPINDYGDKVATALGIISSD